jgi:hypothetical protein
VSRMPAVLLLVALAGCADVATPAEPVADGPSFVRDGGRLTLDMREVDRSGWSGTCTLQRDGDRYRGSFDFSGVAESIIVATLMEDGRTIFEGRAETNRAARASVRTADIAWTSGAAGSCAGATMDGAILVVSSADGPMP